MEKPELGVSPEMEEYLAGPLYQNPDGSPYEEEDPGDDPGDEDGMPEGTEEEELADELEGEG